MCNVGFAFRISRPRPRDVRPPSGAAANVPCYLPLYFHNRLFRRRILIPPYQLPHAERHLSETLSAALVPFFILCACLPLPPHVGVIKVGFRHPQLCCGLWSRTVAIDVASITHISIRASVARFAADHAVVEHVPRVDLTLTDARPVLAVAISIRTRRRWRRGRRGR